MTNEAGITKGDTWEDIEVKWFELGCRHADARIGPNYTNEDYIQGWKQVRRKQLRKGERR